MLPRYFDPFTASILVVGSEWVTLLNELNRLQSITFDTSMISSMVRVVVVTFLNFLDSARTSAFFDLASISNDSPPLLSKLCKNSGPLHHRLKSQAYKSELGYLQDYPSLKCKTSHHNQLPSEYSQLDFQPMASNF